MVIVRGVEQVIPLSLNQHLSRTGSTKSKHCNPHVSRIYCGAVLLNCISFTKVYLINWRVS